MVIFRKLEVLAAGMASAFDEQDVVGWFQMQLTISTKIVKTVLRYWSLAKMASVKDGVLSTVISGT